eukprot:3781889-Rhodomonas_salina.1
MNYPHPEFHAMGILSSASFSQLVEFDRIQADEESLLLLGAASGTRNLKSRHGFQVGLCGRSVSPVMIRLNTTNTRVQRVPLVLIVVPVLYGLAGANYCVRFQISTVILRFMKRRLILGTPAFPPAETRLHTARANCAADRPVSQGVSRFKEGRGDQVWARGPGEAR